MRRGTGNDVTDEREVTSSEGTGNDVIRAAGSRTWRHRKTGSDVRGGRMKFLEKTGNRK